MKRINAHKIIKGPTCLAVIFLLCFAATSCKKLYNLPEEKEFLSPNINYETKSFYPVLGRTTRFGSINNDHSTTPLHFEIVNPRYGDGKPYTDLFQVKPTFIWKALYDGKERSLEEIEAKRELVMKPLMEVDSTGLFVLWNTSTDDLVTPRSADSIDLVQDIRYFDVKISNTGGNTIIKDFQIIPWRVRDYEPSTDINPYNGLEAPDPSDPKNPKKRDYIRPSFMDNIVGAGSDEQLKTDDVNKDLVVYIRRFEGGNGHNLRFVFLDKDNKPINPDNFNETKWDELVHGFNRVRTSEYVQYDVAYPIPLTNYPTPYTSSDNAKVEFGYSRIGFGGFLSTSRFGLNFKILTQGDWEVVFHFKRENPKFDNE
ncbi:hypothetical protein KO02_21280 [Sphingobacterium sp. ML3W]|uniref:DUF5007 domain-containing protein n=1 Tax=Sphingobacterium TaxID=28453 RepID=UPI0004F7E8FD|nr:MULTISPECIES: DUF5007 domain-containing protein [Sphingobacterium]AIM38948.1 hypothetical protein KO02_21280 [Sphingobacterium sp. ML3W]MDH5828827.1 DUF5007 domain-containing protein [Sphingobacterium faecium]